MDTSHDPMQKSGTTTQLRMSDSRMSRVKAAVEEKKKRAQDELRQRRAQEAAQCSNDGCVERGHAPDVANKQSHSPKTQECAEEDRAHGEPHYVHGEVSRRPTESSDNTDDPNTKLIAQLQTELADIQSCSRTARCEVLQWQTQCEELKCEVLRWQTQCEELKAEQASSLSRLMSQLAKTEKELQEPSTAQQEQSTAQQAGRRQQAACEACLVLQRQLQVQKASQERLSSMPPAIAPPTVIDEKVRAGYEYALKAQAMGDDEQAIEVLLEVVNENPRHKQAHRKLAVLFAGWNDTQSEYHRTQACRITGHKTFTNNHMGASPSPVSIAAKDDISRLREYREEAEELRWQLTAAQHQLRYQAGELRQKETQLNVYVCENRAFARSQDSSAYSPENVLKEELQNTKNDLDKLRFMYDALKEEAAEDKRIVQRYANKCLAYENQFADPRAQMARQAQLRIASTIQSMMKQGLQVAVCMWRSAMNQARNAAFARMQRSLTAAVRSSIWDRKVVAIRCLLNLLARRSRSKLVWVICEWASAALVQQNSMPKLWWSLPGISHT